VSPVRYELGFYIPEGGILQVESEFTFLCMEVEAGAFQSGNRSEGRVFMLSDDVKHIGYAPGAARAAFRDTSASVGSFGTSGHPD
jgi:hypothetical protein